MSMAELFNQAAGSVAQWKRLRWAVRLTLVLGVAASITANILHAHPNPISRTISAWPPLALLLTVELTSRIPMHRPLLAFVRVVATVAIAGIAAWVSYWHMQSVALTFGETPMASYLLPISVDGLIVVASVSLVELAGRLRSAAAPTGTVETAAVVHRTQPRTDSGVAAWPALGADVSPAAGPDTSPPGPHDAYEVDDDPDGDELVPEPETPPAAPTAARNGTSRPAPRDTSRRKPSRLTPVKKTRAAAAVVTRSDAELIAELETMLRGGGDEPPSVRAVARQFGIGQERAKRLVAIAGGGESDDAPVPAVPVTADV
jgi:hypothetical protein